MCWKNCLQERDLWAKKRPAEDYRRRADMNEDPEKELTSFVGDC